MTRKRINNIFFCLGLATVVVMLFTFDVSFAELWEHICHAGYWLIPIVGVWLVIYGLNALAWASIVRGNSDGSGQRVSLWRIYRLTITGYALNYATPVGGLGGEPYRILELSKDIGKARASSSVILYAMMHIYSHFWFWFIAIFLYLGLAFIGDVPLNLPIGIALGAIGGLCLLAFYVFSIGYSQGVAFRLLGWAGKIPGLRGWSERFVARHAETLHQVDAQIAALHRQDKRAFYQSLVLEYLSRVVTSSETMFMLLLFGIDCGGGFEGYALCFLHSLLILALTSFCANIVGFLPMQLGVQEGGYVLSIATLGLAPAIGIFVSIISRVREIVWILVGILLMRLPNDSKPLCLPREREIMDH